MQDAQKRRVGATTGLEGRIRQQKKKAKKLTKPRLLGTDADKSVEYCRTVDIVDWLVTHQCEREQITALADAIADIGAKALENLDRDARKRHYLRLADHFWCDVVAALANALDEARELEKELQTKAADALAEMLLDPVWAWFRESRASSDGRRPNQKGTDPSPTREIADQRSSIADAFLRGLTRAVIREALQELTSGSDTLIDVVVFKLRMVAVLLCPDPAAHKAVWNGCLVPLLKGKMSTGLQQQLTALVPWLTEPMTWDRTPTTRATQR